MTIDPPSLILASASSTRCELLARLGLAFSVDPAHIDEQALANEGPQALATRLARQKAEHVAQRHPDAWVIGSDQVASVEGRCFGKPGSHAAAITQLLEVQGRQVEFHTGLCLINLASGHRLLGCEHYAVQLRPLERDDVERYVARDRPYDSAGAFLAERLGSAIFVALSGDDPTTLLGLPLIRLCGMLREVGLDPLKMASTGLAITLTRESP